MPAPQIRFWRDVDGQLKPLIHRGSGITPTRVAMGDLCCCDEPPSWPGRALQARDCCTGEVYTGLHLDLTAPPIEIWGVTIKTTDDKCVWFDLEDFPDAIPIEEATGDEYLEHRDGYEEYEECNDCRCSIPDVARCCYGYLDFPDTPTLERADFRRWFQFAGVTPQSSLFTCRATGTLYDPITGDPLYAKVDSFSFPTGPFTYITPGGYPGSPAESLGCPTDEHAEIVVTTRYFTDSGCTSASARSPSTGYIEAGPGYLSIPADAVGGLAINQNCFESVPYPPPWPCEPITYTNKWGSGDSHAGYGGTCLFSPCCPDDGGV